MSTRASPPRLAAALLGLLPALALAQGAPPAATADATVDATATEPPSLDAGAPAGDPCARSLTPNAPEGPVTVGGFQAADLMVARRACPRSEVGLGVRAGAVIDTPNFYGAVDAQAVLFGSARLTPTLELFGTAELLRLQFAQNATLNGTRASLGQVSVGAAWLARQTEGAAVTPYVRLMLPTSLLTSRVRTVGAEVGTSASLRLSERFEAHGTVSVGGTAGLGAVPAFPRAGLGLNAGLQAALTSWLALVLDVNVQGGYRAPLDFVAPAFAVRLSPVAGLGVELGATLPLAGADRHLAIGGLRLGWRL
jgi:hypothetical protein